MTINEKEKCEFILNELFNNDFEFALSYHREFGCRYNRLGLLDWEESHKDLIDKLGIRICSGATKLCILKDDMNVVIKIGFLLETRDPNTPVTDYCALEYENYLKACAWGVNEYFATMEPIDYTAPSQYDIKCFAQEWAANNEDEIYDMFYQYYAKEDCLDEWIISSYDCSPDEVNEYKGEYISSEIDEMEPSDAVLIMFDDTRLEDFVIAFDINDLHTGNWGYTKNGELKIIDYSGYRG